MSEWLRKKILSLIGRDIENIARDAYDEGCYVTARRNKAEEVIRLHYLTTENEKLREMMIERANMTMPEIVILQNTDEG